MLLVIAGLVLTLFVPAPSAASQDPDTASITGTVTDSGGRTLPAVDIQVVGTTRTTRSDAQGAYTLRGVPAGRGALRATAPGYRAVEVPFEAARGSTVRVDFSLAAEPVTLDAIAVTGTMRRRSVSESPVKVEVVPSAVLQRNVTNNLTEAIQFVNGLYTQVDGVTIQIHRLDVYDGNVAEGRRLREDVPVVAVWVPGVMAQDWIVQSPTHEA